LLGLSQTHEVKMHSFNESIRWVQAIIFQGERVLSAHADHSMGGTISDKSRVEEQFFLNACEKAVRWTKSLSSEGRNEEVRKFLPADEIRKFKASINSTDIRNLREHEEEYLVTNGKSLDDKVTDASTSSNDLKIIVEPGITVIRNGDILIGGKVSVRNSMDTAKIFNTELVKAQHNYARFKSPILNSIETKNNPYVFAGLQLK